MVFVHKLINSKSNLIFKTYDLNGKLDMALTGPSSMYIGESIVGKTDMIVKVVDA